MAVGYWNIQPSEFWKMTPREWWVICNHKTAESEAKLKAMSRTPMFTDKERKQMREMHEKAKRGR